MATVKKPAAKPAAKKAAAKPAAKPVAKKAVAKPAAKKAAPAKKAVAAKKPAAKPVAKKAVAAEWIERKRVSEFAEDRDLIVMGDCNIPGAEGPAFKALTRHGLVMPRVLRQGTHGSNLEKNKRYDQILHLPQYPESFIKSGGVLDFYVDDHRPLFPRLDKGKFTYQMSDHQPLWVQINTDIAGHRLDQLIQSKE